MNKNLISPGCYDGSLYFMDALCGRLLATYKTNGPIKCSPVICPRSNRCWFGSHDHFLYSVLFDIVSERVETYFSVNLGALVSASPVFLEDLVIVCSTAGTTYAFREDEMAWSQTIDGKPIFSTPAVIPHEKIVIVASVSGTLFALNYEGDVVSRNFSHHVF